MTLLSALNVIEKKQIATLAFLTIFCVFLEIILHFYLGISTGYTHFFYVLLVLAAIWYQWRAVILALCLAITHFSIGYFVFEEPLWVPFLRSAMFVLVTLLVGIMAEGLKKAEAEVCVRSSEWELTFNSTSDGICLLDRDQKILRCNNSMVDIVNGIPVQDLIGRNCWETVHKTTGPIVECPFVAAKKTLTRQTAEVHEWDKWFEISVDPIIDDSGAFAGAVHIMRDITGRKVMEESLRQSHQILQSILDTIMVRVFWKDRELKYLGCNRQFAKDAGFTEAKDLIGKDDYEMGWRDQAEIYRSDDRSVIASGTAKVMIEEPQTTPDGRIIWLLTSKVPLRDAAGEISGVLGTYMDISEYRNVKECIRESEEKYKTFFATSKDCVFITSKEGRFVDFNDETPAFFGYRDREEFGTVRVQDLYGNAIDRQEHIRAIEQSGFVKDYPVDLRRKNGSIIHTLVTSIARKDISGKVIGFQGTIKDITEQRQAEAALRESFAIFKTVMDSLDALVYVADMKTYEILFVNLYGRKIWGDLTGKICWKSLQVNQKGPCPFCTNEKLLDSNGNPSEILIWEFQNTVNGKVYECHDRAIRWTDGRIVRIEIANDITDRKRVEEALKESERKFRDLFENFRDGIVVADIKTQKFIDSNEMFSHLLGYNPEEIRTLSISDIHPEDRLSDIRDVFEKLMKHEITIIENIPVKRKDGNIFYADISAYPVKLAGKTYLVGVFRDITDRRKAEEVIAQSERKFHTMADFTLDWEYWLAPENSFVYISPSCERITGYSPKEFIADPPLITRIVHPDDAILVSNHFNTIHKSPDPGVIDFRIVGKDGETHWLAHSCMPVYDSSGTYLGRRASNRDISDRKQAEEALRDSQNRSAMLLEAIPDMMFIISRDGVYRDFSVPDPSVLAVPVDQIIGTNIRDSGFKKESTDAIIHYIGLTLDTKKLHQFEYELVVPDGERYYEARMVALNEDSVLGIVRDITKRKRAEAALTESFAVFKTVMDSVDALVYVSDMKTYEILFINLYGRKIWGDLTGKICWKSLQENQKGPCPFCTNEKLLDSDGNPSEILIWEFQNTVNGKVYECHDRAIRWTDGRIVRIEIASDITGRKQAEKALKESNERYISYIKEAAMRLKTPVEVVERNVNGIITDINTGDIDYSQVLLQLQIQVKNMEQIRQNILDLNKTIIDGYGEVSPASKKFLTE